MLKLNKLFVAENLKVNEVLGTEAISLKIEEISSTETFETSTFSGQEIEVTRIHLHGKIFPIYVKETTMEIAKQMMDKRK